MYRMQDVVRDTMLGVECKEEIKNNMLELRGHLELPILLVIFELHLDVVGLKFDWYGIVFIISFQEINQLVLTCYIAIPARTTNRAELSRSRCGGGSA
jgi:hypothetical protein